MLPVTLTRGPNATLTMGPIGAFACPLLFATMLSDRVCTQQQRVGSAQDQQQGGHEKISSVKHNKGQTPRKAEERFTAKGLAAGKAGEVYISKRAMVNDSKTAI